MEAVNGLTTNETAAQAAYLEVFGQAAKQLAKVLRPENSTYVSTSEKDRIRPPQPEIATQVVAPRDREKSLASSPNLAGVASGTLTINNTPISINPTADSFQEIIARINGSDAGVSAYFDSEANRLVITSDTNAKIEITKDTSGFLEEVNINPGTYLASTRLPAFSKPGSAISGSDVIAKVAKLAESLSQSGLNKLVSKKDLEGITQSLSNIFEAQFHGDLQTLGVTLEPRGSLSFDRAAAFDGVIKNPKTFEDVFLSESGVARQVPVTLQMLALPEEETGKNINRVA